MKRLTVVITMCAAFCAEARVGTPDKPAYLRKCVPIVADENAAPMAARAECIVTYTFDDGLADQYTLAYPMFREAGVSATFFIVGSKIGDTKGFRSKAERDTPFMTWEQVRDMAANGMEIASHGWAHAKYAKMGRAAILDDIRRNQSVLKNNAGIDCVSFASPYSAKKGADGADVESLAKECGILAVRVSVKRAGGGMTAEKLNAIVEAAKNTGEWIVFMMHGIARGYDAWENPEELRRHLDWVKSQKEVRVLTFADAAKARTEPSRRSRFLDSDNSDGFSFSNSCGEYAIIRTNSSARERTTQ